MPHAGVGAELAAPGERRRSRIVQTDQSGAQLIQCVARMQRGQTPVGQQGGQRGLVVKRQHQVALSGGHATHRPERLATLGHARNQAHMGRERHARQAAAQYPIGQVCCLAAARGDPTKHIAPAGAGSHFCHQFIEVGRFRVGMHHGGRRHKFAR